MSFINFIKNCKHDLELQGKDFYFVLGNESCDFDSIASALTYAYHMNNFQTGVKYSLFQI